MKNFFLSLCSMLIWSIGWYYATAFGQFIAAMSAAYIPTWCFFVFFYFAVPIILIIGLLPYSAAMGISALITKKLDEGGKKIECVMLVISSIIGSGYYIYKLVGFIAQCKELNPGTDFTKLIWVESVLCFFAVVYFMVGAFYVPLKND